MEYVWRTIKIINMKVTNCIWEIENIGVETAEISIDSINNLDMNELVNLEKSFKYIVIKTPVNQFGLASLLRRSGYDYMESQFYISKKFKDFNREDRLVKPLFPLVSFDTIDSNEDFEETILKITPGMFSTDRIAIDPYFGMEKSRNRYVNWMRTEFEKKEAVFIKFFYDGDNVGVGMHKLNNGILTGLVGGVFEQYQDEGLGMLTPAAPFIYAYKGGDPFKKMVTCISSNNMPVIQFYNYLGFQINDLKYVFIKHRQ